MLSILACYDNIINFLTYTGAFQYGWKDSEVLNGAGFRGHRKSQVVGGGSGGIKLV